MNRRTVIFVTLGSVLLFLAVEMFFGMLLGSDMCWYGDPFVSPPCPKNYVADPFQMFSANIYAQVTTLSIYGSWGFRLYFILMFAIFFGSLIAFALALRERQSHSQIDSTESATHP